MVVFICNYGVKKAWDDRVLSASDCCQAWKHCNLRSGRLSQESCGALIYVQNFRTIISIHVWFMQMWMGSFVRSVMFTFMPICILFLLHSLWFCQLHIKVHPVLQTNLPKTVVSMLDESKRGSFSALLLSGFHFLAWTFRCTCVERLFSICMENIYLRLFQGKSSAGGM